MVPSQLRPCLAGLLAIGMVFSPAMAAPARAVLMTEMEIDLAVDPNAESMTVVTRLYVAENTGDEPLLCYFCKPTRMDYLHDTGSARDVPYKVEPLSLPAIVLVDECAHQWNAYHVRLPDYLAEGVSEYTDNLFIERFVDSSSTATRMALYREAYSGIVDLLNRLKPLKDKGMSVAQAAVELGLSVEAVAPYWPYANWSELPISDPRVFPTLYSLKGVLAIDALRTELWYHEPGLPEY